MLFVQLIQLLTVLCLFFSRTIMPAQMPGISFSASEPSRQQLFLTAQQMEYRGASWKGSAQAIRNIDSPLILSAAVLKAVFLEQFNLFSNTALKQKISDYIAKVNHLPVMRINGTIGWLEKGSPAIAQKLQENSSIPISDNHYEWSLVQLYEERNKFSAERNKLLSEMGIPINAHYPYELTFEDEQRIPLCQQKIHYKNELTLEKLRYIIALREECLQRVQEIKWQFERELKVAQEHMATNTEYLQTTSLIEQEAKKLEVWIDKLRQHQDILWEKFADVRSENERNTILDNIRDLKRQLGESGNMLDRMNECIVYGQACRTRHTAQEQQGLPVQSSSTSAVTSSQAVMSREYSCADSKIVLQGTEQQHQLYGESYKILQSAQEVKDRVAHIPQAHFYIESAEELSYAAVEIAQSNNIEIAYDCNYVAQNLLDQAEYILSKTALVAAGAAKGGVKGVAAIAMAPIDCIRLGYSILSIAGSTARDQLYSLVTNPKSSIENWGDSLKALGRIAFDNNSTERKALQEKMVKLISAAEDGIDAYLSLPLEDQIEFLVEFAVPCLVTPQQVVAKVPGLEKARQVVGKVVQAEVAGLQKLAKHASAHRVEYDRIQLAQDVASEIGKIEKKLGKKLQGQELFAAAKKIEQKLISENAPILSSTLQGVHREVVLPKVATYEQARNRALEIIGEVNFATGKPQMGKQFVAEDKIVGRRWHGTKVTLRLDYDPIKGPHINVTDFRDARTVSVAIPFEGTEETFKTLLKHLQG